MGLMRGLVKCSSILGVMKPIAPAIPSGCYPLSSLVVTAPWFGSSVPATFFSRGFWMLRMQHMRSILFMRYEQDASLKIFTFKNSSSISSNSEWAGALSIINVRFAISWQMHSFASSRNHCKQSRPLKAPVLVMNSIWLKKSPQWHVFVIGENVKETKYKSLLMHKIHVEIRFAPLFEGVYNIVDIRSYIIISHYIYSNYNILTLVIWLCRIW